MFVRIRPMFRWGFSVLGLVILLVGSVYGQEIDVVPPSNRLVNDRAGMLSSGEERLLEQKLRGYADSTSTQIVIVTIESLNGVPPAMYATELGRQWGVGQKGKDNGVVILVSKSDHEVFIAPGYGLEGAIPDAIASRIYRNIIRPAFREGRFYAGLDRATDAIIAAAEGEFEAEAVSASRDEGGGMDTATGFVLLVILYFVLTGWRKGGGKGGRRRRGGMPFIIWGGGHGGHGHHGGFGGGGFGGGGFGGFGGGSFGGGGAGGSW